MRQNIYQDYGLDVQESKTVRYLDRWRLEVKEEDMEKFKRGELMRCAFLKIPCGNQHKGKPLD